MADQNCENCAFRAKYDNNPKSFLGRLWRWHINFCPGWKSYMTSLSQDDKLTLADKYSFKKYL
jgi:hypothetical protein